MIEVRGLVKHYRVHERAPGVGAALKSLFKREYRVVKAVDEISFSIAAGERVGFLGPNGAGKTTTLKMLSGLLYPTGGEAKVAGLTPFSRSADFLKSIMLVAGQKQQLLWDLPAQDTFELNRAIYGVARVDYQRTLDELVDLLKLAPLIHKPVRQLSLGERMKCELAAALLHRPRVLFLDEPTIGLDVTMQVAVREFIRRYNEQHGATVILTSHYMEDVAALCPRIIVIDHGHIVYDGALGELVRTLRPEKRVRISFARAVEASELAAIGGKAVSHTPLEAQLSVQQSELQHVVGSAFAQLPVSDLTVEDPPLEEVLGALFARGAEA
ncbi:MAG TPA: ATP-binding cassette domain-containing protein [Polyangiales bacterium]